MIVHGLKLNATETICTSFGAIVMMQSQYDIINSSFLRDEAAVTCVDTVLSVSRHLFPKHLHPHPPPYAPQTELVDIIFFPSHFTVIVAYNTCFTSLYFMGT